MVTRRNIIELILLELLCYVPVAIILGNVLPAIGPFKIHWIYIGLVFFVTLISLAKHVGAHSILFLIVIFGIIQYFIGIEFSLPAFVDFISGPLLFIAVVNLITSDKHSLNQIRRYRRKILFGFAIPISIAFLQLLKVLPLEFLNATYVNVTIYGSEVIERVNGFLFHGIELATMIFFFFISIGVVRSHLKMYFLLAIMIFFEFITIIKSGILTAILFTGYFAYFIDQRLRSFKSIAIACLVIFGFSYLYILIPDIKEQRLNFDGSAFKFEDQLFTGRGFIWNTYIRGIKDFTIPQIMFGGGYGSAPEIFTRNLIGNVAQRKWAPGPHNQLLELFVNGGLFAIWLIAVILIKQYQKLALIFSDNKGRFTKYYLGVVLIPLFAMGITAPIMSMYIYWCGLSTVMLSLKLKFS